MAAGITEIDSVYLQQYADFLQQQRRSKTHPLDDSIENINKIANAFMNLFRKAPDSMKKNLATSPLFPEDVEFHTAETKDSTRDNTRPLNYIMFLANENLLKEISPYLGRADWERRGPYNSTFMHCLIAGIEKLSSKYNGKPTACAKILLQNYPASKTELNTFNITPAYYLDRVEETLHHNLQHIKEYGGGGYGGANKCISLKDGTLEAESHYESALLATKELKDLLI